MPKIKIDIGIKTQVRGIEKRLKSTQPLIVQLAFAFTKAEAKRFINNFQNGIRQNNFKLTPLAPITVEKKRDEGLPKPTVPLYGAGDDKKTNSYINMLRILKLKNGWKVYPSRKKHWKSKLKLNELFEIHEYGSLIQTKNAVIRIPPRPAFLKAKLRTLNQAKAQIKRKDIRKALNQIMKQNKHETYNKILSKFEKQSMGILTE